MPKKNHVVFTIHLFDITHSYTVYSLDAYSNPTNLTVLESGVCLATEIPQKAVELCEKFNCENVKLKGQILFSEEIAKQIQKLNSDIKVKCVK